MIEPQTSTWLALGAAALAAVILARRRRRPALSPSDLQELRRRGVQVLDVRTEEEFLQGHLPGSRNLPLGDLDPRMAELDRTRPILTVCASGMRSAMARRRLLRAGFRDVRNGGPWQALETEFRAAEDSRYTPV